MNVCSSNKYLYCCTVFRNKPPPPHTQFNTSIFLFSAIIWRGGEWDELNSSLTCWNCEQMKVRWTVNSLLWNAACKYSWNLRRPSHTSACHKLLLRTNSYTCVFLRPHSGIDRTGRAEGKLCCDVYAIRVPSYRPPCFFSQSCNITSRQNNMAFSFLRARRWDSRTCSAWVHSVHEA